MSRSAIPPTLDDDASCFEQARQSGRLAARQLSELAPLSERQRAWLSGFFAGLLSESDPVPLHAGPSRRVPESAAPEPVRAIPTSPRFDSVTSSNGSVNSGALLRAADGVGTATTGVVSSGTATAGDSSSNNPAPSGGQSALGNEPGKDGAPPTVVAPVFHPAASTVQLRAALATGVKNTAFVVDDVPAKYSADNPFAARIAELIPSQTRSPATWRLTLDVEGSGLRCRPGDQLGVVPSNDPDLVRKLLRRLGAKGQENVSTTRGTGPAWRALLEEFSISTVTNPMLELLARTTRNPHEAAQLELIATSPDPFDLTLAALLRRFPSAKPALNDFVNCLSPLLPQYFPLATARSRHANMLEALVVSSPHESRSVVAQLAAEKLGVGDWLPVFVDPRPAGHPPAEIDAPAIVLAPGAGSACAYAFLAERAATRGSGRNWLFTSPAASDSAIPYAEHFAAWQTSRVLTRLDVAPDSDLGQRFLEQAEMVQAWIVDGSYLYLYADARTCTQLEGALADLLMTRARISSDEAYTRLAAMRVSGQLRVVVTE